MIAHSGSFKADIRARHSGAACDKVALRGRMSDDELLRAVTQLRFLGIEDQGVAAVRVVCDDAAMRGRRKTNQIGLSPAAQAPRSVLTKQACKPVAPFGRAATLFGCC